MLAICTLAAAVVLLLSLSSVCYRIPGGLACSTTEQGQQAAWMAGVERTQPIEPQPILKGASLVRGHISF